MCSVQSDSKRSFVLSGTAELYKKDRDENKEKEMGEIARVQYCTWNAACKK